MSGKQALKDAFERFTQFGSGSITDLSGPSLSTMTNAQFAKFCRESQLLDETVTSTDVDIAFAKVKPKGLRRVTFGQFVEALGELAAKKYGDDGLDKLIEEVSKAAPEVHGVVESKTEGVFDRLLDTSSFPVTHRNRFNNDGSGKGKDGRVEAGDTLKSELKTLVNRESPSTKAAKAAKANTTPTRASPAAKTTKSPRTSTVKSPTAAPVRSSPRTSPTTKKADTAAASANATPSPKKRTHVVTASTESLEKKAVAPKKTDLKSSLGSLRSPAADLKSPRGYLATSSTQSTPNLSPAKGGSVFDRLTDTSGYTGTHKERFNKDGTGKGLAGRDSASVTNLSQMLR